MNTLIIGFLIGISVYEFVTRYTTEPAFKAWVHEMLGKAKQLIFK